MVRLEAVSDLTVKILQEMRDDIRGLREDNRALGTHLDHLATDMKAGFEAANSRFEVIETSLRDLAQQMVMLSRAIKVALESRAGTEQKLDDHERRIADLERRVGP